MTDVFVVRNQLGHYWGKSKAWADGRDPKAVMRTSHEDEAVNTLFELSSKDFELRGEVIQVAVSERGDPVIEASEHLIEPEPEPSHEAEPEAEVQAETAEQAGAEDGAAEPAVEEAPVEGGETDTVAEGTSSTAS